MKLLSLRPNSLNEFVGNNNIKHNIQIYLKASHINHEPLDHCLFYGLPGTGKTSMALIIANEQKTKIKIYQGSNIQKNIDIYNIALNIKQNDVIFIDEIHAINKMCFELLYSLMEDFSFDITIGKDFNSKTTRLSVPHFTLVGATTSLTKIPKPLEERFGIIQYFDNYNIDDIAKIIKNACQKIKCCLTKEEIYKIAKNAKGIPRISLNILSRVCDFKLINNKTRIESIFKHIGIYVNGLNNNDVKYLNCFNNYSSQIGIKTISQMTNFEVEYIEQKIEPFLFKMKYVTKTSKGRIILPKGKGIIKQLNKTK